MPINEEFFAVRVIPVDNTQWWPVTTPIACAAWAIQNFGGGSVEVSTDQVNTDQLAPGAQDYVPKRSVPGAPYPAGATFCYLKNPNAGTVNVAARFAL